MAKWSNEKMADLTRKLADTAIDYKKRCEELEAKLVKANANHERFEREWYLANDRIEELEAKLAKAVEALGRIASNEFAGVMLTSMPPQDAAAHFARTTLAELKGDGDE